MVISAKISMCRVTCASKMFQRNCYLPTYKPLTPKDALRRKIITGRNVLGDRIEHYIPVLESHEERMRQRSKLKRGQPVIKKRVRMNEKHKYVTPSMDDADSPNFGMFKNTILRKPKGNGQMYLYEVTDKRCHLIINYQMERAIKDKDIIDVIMALRSEKIVCKMRSGMKVTLKLNEFQPQGKNIKLYRGSGFTRENAEVDHHHGRDTFQLAQLFEAKEQGMEEWELEMMRLESNKKKSKKNRAVSNADLQKYAGNDDSVDWGEDEDDSEKEEQQQNNNVQDEEEEEEGDRNNQENERKDSLMQVDDMEKTRNVSEKLKLAGEEAINQLPKMEELEEVVGKLETGEMTELASVSGVKLELSNNVKRFVVGQMVTQDNEEKVFVPGQTLNDEYCPGVTVNLKGEPTLVPGLITGEKDDDQNPVFLPGESTINQDGQLQFESTQQEIDDNLNSYYNNNNNNNNNNNVRKKQKYEDEPIVIRRRVYEETTEETTIKERKKRRPPQELLLSQPSTPPALRIDHRVQSKSLEDSIKEQEEQRTIRQETERKRQEEERKRQKAKELDKQLEEEKNIDKLRLQIRQKLKAMNFESPAPYVPVEPVKKSEKLEEYERSILKGTFLEDDNVKRIMEAARNATKINKYETNNAIVFTRNLRV